MRCGEHAEVLNASFAAVKNGEDTVDDAFKEELTIRLSGRVKSFDSPMEKGGWWSRMVFGSAYKWEGKRGGGALQVEENAPQAVIADGSKLQAVEGGLLLLSSACKAANVPLFVINDQRLWGGEKGGDVGQEEEVIATAKISSGFCSHATLSSPTPYTPPPTLHTPALQCVEGLEGKGEGHGGAEGP